MTVSVDDRAKQQLMIDRIVEGGGAEPDFVMLSDPGHRVIDRYGLFNEDAPPRRPVPHPATFVVDKEGVVRWKFVEVDYRVRPSHEDILAVLKELQEGTVAPR